MQKIHYYLLAGIACLSPIATQAKAKPQPKKKLEPAIATIANKSALANQALDLLAIDDSNAEEDEFKAQLKEQRKLELENALIRARLERELADLRAEIERLRWKKEAYSLQWELEQAEQIKTHEQELLGLNQEKDRLMANNALIQAKFAKVVEEFNLATAELQNKASLEKVETEKLRSEIEKLKAQEERNKHADGGPVYLDDPLLQDGTLVLSDRVIELAGIINSWSANFITDRIDYFNNQNKKPIFIVIENSPGGSVAAGARILRAMDNSEAPIYVVVKSFAASMAALIATLANKCYAYPDAIILHHQPWTFFTGNIRQVTEGLVFCQEWWKRLGGKVADKMGISLAKFDKQLYEKSADGDWMEFADNAKKIKWVDHIIKGVRNTANRDLPDVANYTFSKYLEKYYGLAPTVENGLIYLPKLDPKDFYYLYNPDNRYQLVP
jgi:ATP-dependent Clp protease protease subunit